MDFQELQEFLSQACQSPNGEYEKLELKEAKVQYSVMGWEKRNRNSIYAYTVALGNEWGWKLLLWVKNDKTIVGTNLPLNFNDVKTQIYNKIGKRIQIEEVLCSEGKKVIVILIPPRWIGEVLKFYGVPLMRVGEELHDMDDATQRKILLEWESDWSAKIVPWAGIQDLDDNALREFEILYKKYKGTSLSVQQILVNLWLIRGWDITYASLVLLGKQESLRKYLANAEVIFQYRNNKHDITYSDRENYREAYILSQAKIWNKIYSRNQITQIHEWFITQEIPSYNEEAVKEAINNAIVHRDYRDPGSITIKQSSQEFEVQSPWGFLPWITVENIVDTPSKPRNRLLAETLEHIRFVQRAWQGMDTIFQTSIEEGKWRPDFSQSDEYNVVLKISAQIKNKWFLEFLQKVIWEKQFSFWVHDLILLQDLVDNSWNILKSEVKRFIDMGIVEQIWNTRGAKYVLSHKYYKDYAQAWTHTRLVGISRDAKKHLMLQHLEKNKSWAVLSDFVQAFPDITRKDISNLLQELKKQWKIISEGDRRWAVWKVK